MITNLIIIVLPRVEVKVLKHGLVLQRRAGVHVIQSLGVHIEEICVALHGVHVDELIQIAETRLFSKDLHRLDLGKLVKVAGSNDAGLGVLFENLRNESLIKNC